ncbi:lactate utilization protein C [Vibrio vulnificus]|uniref:LutC/YkgG family protein n=1 Tax=Vibrio vulnificus TaxID=672 RepID=UPI0028DF36A1|nr:lactate utilization protein C [Vibrio vulnificus]MDT8824855.1 lactate utilization protein C [Vibrio vulnificus]
MSHAKNNILNRLKAANAIEKSSAHLSYQPWGHEQNVTQNEKVHRFITTMEASHAEMHTIEASQLESTIARIVSDKACQTAAIGTDGEYIHAFRNGLTQVKVVEFERHIEEWKSELFNQIDVGITHVLAGIADTGALVLWPSEYEPRTLSLVPPKHIAVIKQSTLKCNFLEVMVEQEWTHHMPTNALLISGPSKTADIQQTLAYGAHGPSELVVLLLTDQ